MHLRFLVAATTAEALQRQKTAWEQSFAWRRRRSETKGNEMGRRRNLTLWNIRICWWEQFCFFFLSFHFRKALFIATPTIYEFLCVCFSHHHQKTLSHFTFVLCQFKETNAIIIFYFFQLFKIFFIHAAGCDWPRLLKHEVR